MIRINLLSAREIQAEIGRRQDLTIAAVSIGALLALMLLVFLYQFYRTTALEREAANLRAEIAKLESETKEVAVLQRTIADLKQKVKVIDDLSQKKVGPVRVMESLSIAVPEKLWLTEFKENSGSLAMSGMAIDNQTVADFLRALAASPYFSDVDLVETSQVQQERLVLKKFSLKSRLMYQADIGRASAKNEPGKAPGGSPKN